MFRIQDTENGPMFVKKKKKKKVHEINTVRVEFSVKWRGMTTVYRFTARPQDVARGRQ
jgi:hypothetical protein